MLKVGIIGCGSIARQRHAAEYAQNAHVEIAGFYDAAPQRAREMAEVFGGVAYDTLDDLLAETQIELVSVCVANADHAGVSIRAMEVGKHVLCEKPMATSLAECEAMIACSRRTGKKLMIAHNQRFTDAHVLAKDLLERGELGSVLSFATTFGHAGPEMWSIDRGAGTWFFRKDRAALGSMADLGVHKVDLLRFLLGREVEGVQAFMRTLNKRDADGALIGVDDNFVGLLSFEGGTIGTIATSWTHYGEENNSTQLYCEKGIVKIYSNPEYAVEVVYKDKKRVYYKMDAIQSNEDAVQKSSGVIDAFVRCVREDTEPPVSGEDAIKTMKVIFACIEAAANGATGACPGTI